MTDEELFTAADAARKANQAGLKMLGKMTGEVDDPTVALFLTTLQVALSSNSELVGRLTGRLREVEGELEFRRSVDDFGGE